MIATDAALYGAARAALLDHAADQTHHETRAQGHGSPRAAEAPSTCGCGQELAGVRRQHCPRCGCCLA